MTKLSDSRTDSENYFIVKDGRTFIIGDCAPAIKFVRLSEFGGDVFEATLDIPDDETDSMIACNDDDNTHVVIGDE